MVTPQILQGSLKPFSGKEVVISKRQSTDKIIGEVLDAHVYFASEYDSIAKYFDSGDLHRLENELFDFCKMFLNYNVESEKWQSTRSPAGILALGAGRVGVDCKHYSQFCGGIVDALCRRGWKINWTYRFASYDNDKIPGHVFVVIFEKGGRQVWVDPVLSFLNCRYPYPNFYYDQKPRKMPLVRLSGVHKKNVMAGIPAPYQNLTSAQFAAGLQNGTVILDRAQVIDALGSGAANIEAQESIFLSKVQQITTVDEINYNNQAIETAWNAVVSSSGNAQQGAVVRYYLMQAANSFGFSLDPSTFNITYFQAWLELNFNHVYQIIAYANNILGKAGRSKFSSPGDKCVK